MTGFNDPVLDMILAGIERRRESERGPALPGPVSIPMSKVGGDLREAWLSWRWCLPQQPPPEQQMVFDDGHYHEAQIIQKLRDAGLEVHDTRGDGKQFELSIAGGHCRGKIDGLLRGHPDAPGAWHILEVKTYNTKPYEALRAAADPVDHIRNKAPDHWCQLNLYGHLADVPFALYVVKSREKGHIWPVRIELDRAEGEGIVRRAESVRAATAPPRSEYRDRTDYRIAKFKDAEYQSWYWGDELPPTVNCRNCRHSMPVDRDTGRGGWYCGRHRADLDVDRQAAGCADHVWIPALVGAQKVTEHAETGAVCYQSGDVQFWNVPEQHRGSTGYSSREMVALSRAKFAPDVVADALTAELRREMGATVVDAGPGATDREPPF